MASSESSGGIAVAGGEENPLRWGWRVGTERQSWRRMTKHIIRQKKSLDYPERARAGANLLFVFTIDGGYHLVQMSR